MARSVRDQLLDKGLVKLEETPEAKRSAARAARPAEVEKELPPDFEAPARGVIVASRHRAASARVCVDCGAALPSSQRITDGARRCAECAATPA